jgi:serine/threonine protein kinase
MKIKLMHENLVQYLGCYQSESGIDIVVQHCKGGDLFTIIHDDRFTLSIDSRIDILLEIAIGMNYLHQNGFLHMDLKSKNILLADKKDKKPMISNYGIASVFQNTETFKAFSKHEDETVRFKAPETLKYGNFSKESDIYAFGILMWELFSRKVPFDEMKKEDIINFVSGKGRPNMDELDKETPKVIINIIKNCFVEDKRKRPNFEEISDLLNKL